MQKARLVSFCRPGDGFILETGKAVEELKAFILEHGLPLTDMALFGILCPYCGKSDRIRQLEEPSLLGGRIDFKRTAIYSKLWARVNRPDGTLGVCKFCQNLLLLDDTARAQPLFE
jgi:hypothetical protein